MFEVSSWQPLFWYISIGNKIDRDDREIPRHIGEEFAQQHDMYFLETSAKEADNVETLFMEIATRLTHEAKSTEGNHHYINNGVLTGRECVSDDGESGCCSRFS